MIINRMKEWKEYSLDEICTDIFAGGDAKKLNPTKEKTNNNKIPIYANSVENEGLYGYCQIPIVSKPAITIAARGAGTGFVAYREKPFTPIVRLITLVTKNIVDTKFLYYNLKNKGIKGDGSAIPQITIPMIKKEIVSIPNIHVQKKITGILSPLDGKIKLNHRINENLAQQAQALFKSWFVDFEPFKDGKFVDSEFGKIPEGWKVGILSDIANITMGQSPKGTSYNEIGNGIVFYQGRADFGNRFPSIRLFTTEPSRYAEPHSVLLSVRAPVGDINVAVEKCCIGRGLASILSKDNHQSFILYTMYSLKKELDKFNSEGTVFGSINRFSIENLKIVIPPIDVMDEFEHLVSKIDNLLLNLFQETTRLEQLRDILLPRLMSGELKITDIE